MSPVRPNRTWTALSMAPLFTFLFLFSLLPLLVVVDYSATHLGGFAGVWELLWGSRLPATVARRALWNSFEQGTLSAGFAILWGLPVGAFLALHPSWTRQKIRGMLMLPFLLPSLVMIFGTFTLFGAGGVIGSVIPSVRFLSEGLAGIVFINVMFNGPLVALYTATALDGVPRHLEESARVLGASRFQVFTTVWLRPVIAGASLGGLLTFILSFLSFAPPLLVGGPSYYTLEDWIYSLDRNFGLQGPSLAAGLAVWALVLLSLPIVAYLWLLRGSNALGSRESRENSLQSRNHRPTLASKMLAMLAWALIGMEVMLMASVFILSFTQPDGTKGWQNWATLSSNQIGSIVQAPLLEVLFNTVFFALVAAAIVFCICLPLFIPNSSFPRTWELLTFLPLLLSPVILALGLELAWGGVLGTPALVWLLIVFSQVNIGLPFSLQGMGLSFRHQSTDLTASARCLGASPLRAFADVKLPLGRTGVRSAVLLTLAIGLGEFAATNFLYVPRYTTLTVEMYVLQETRHLGASFAAAALLALLSTALFIIYSLSQERKTILLEMDR